MVFGAGIGVGWPSTVSVGDWPRASLSLSSPSFAGPVATGSVAIWVRPERISGSEELGYIRDGSKIVSHAGLVTLLRGPVAENAASREHRSARCPTRANDSRRPNGNRYRVDECSEQRPSVRRGSSGGPSFWDRQTRRILRDLKDMDRGWDALVIAEPQRAFSGTQFEPEAAPPRPSGRNPHGAR